MAVKRCRTTICDLPEDCLTKILALTTPKDVCRVSAVSSTYRSAADSNGVWERFLPSDYLDILSRCRDTSLRRVQPKKDLYRRLSDQPILIDSGLKSFQLDKLSGKKCYMLAARDLSIVWGDALRHWQWKCHRRSRFLEVAELLYVTWLEIGGSINSKMLSFDTNYAAYLVFRLNSRRSGFARKPAEAGVGIKGLEIEKRTVFLDLGRAQRRLQLPSFSHLGRPRDDVVTEENEFLKRREDGWMEVELGEYFVTGGDGDIVMSLLETKHNWKKGLVIQGIEIRPKKCT